MLFQILFTLFYCIYTVLLLRKKWRQQIRHTELIFRIGFWTIALCIVIYPEITFQLAKFMGIQRGVDLILYTSIVILFYGAFNQRLKNIKSSILITELTRKIAILEYDINTKSKKYQ